MKKQNQKFQNETQQNLPVDCDIEIDNEALKLRNYVCTICGSNSEFCGCHID